MKVVWIVLGVLLGACLICGGGAYMLFNKGKAAFDDAGKFGDTTFQEVATSWDPAVLKSKASPDLTKESSPEAIDALMTRLSQTLGPVKTFKSSTTGINFNSNNGESVTTVDWSADATFEKGPGTVNMKLIKRGDDWKVFNFNVHSELLKASPETPDSGDKSSQQ